MSRKVQQFDEFQSQPSLNGSSTVLDACDFSVSDNSVNDILTDFDVNTNDIQYFDVSINDVNYFHSSQDLSSSCKATLYSTAINTNVQSFQSGFDEVLSPDAFELLIEQQEKQQTNNEPSFSSLSYKSIDHHDPSSKDMSNYEAGNIYVTREETATTRSDYSSTEPSFQFSHLNNSTEPITFTIDQFQALINLISNTSQTNVNTISTLLEHSTIVANNIPLRIVDQTNKLPNADISNKFSHQDSITKNGNSSESIVVNRNDNCPRRTSTSNATEKRYRSSINEKIYELKEIVAASDGKIQKSGILRRTVEYIGQLQSTNRQLEEENSTLKSVLKQLNLTTTDLPTNNDVQSSKRNSLVKKSTTSTSTSSSECKDDLYSPAKKRNKQANSTRGMVDRSRLVLCCFMLCVLMTNPFNYLLDRIHSSDNDGTTEVQLGPGSRTLKTIKDAENFNSLLFLNISWKQLVTWMLNIAICLVCLVKIFVHGEPIVHESDMDEYYTYKKKADALMDKNQLSEASIYYKKCCEKLYVSVDQTYLYYFSSITWQLIRLFLNVIFVGRWLTYWSGWTKSIDTRYHNYELNSCYLQLWKIEYHQSKSLLNIFNLFLLTLNTSINAGKKINTNKRNEINFLSALTLKKLDGLFSVFTIFFLKFLIPIDTNDIWLLHVDRLNQFIFEKNIYLFKQKLFLESIRIQFFEYILYDNIQNQLLFQDEQPQQFIIKNKNQLDLFSWWQHSLQVIRCISNDKQNINNITSTALLQHMNSSDKTIYYMVRSIKIVNEAYILIIETIHVILLILTNNDDDQTNSTRILFLKQLGKSSKLLTSMIESCYITDNDDNLDMAIKTLLLDSVLSLRLRLLTCSMTNNNKKIPFLDDFQRELDCYRRVNQFMKLPKQKLYLFESIFRTLSGLNPLLTQTLFECAIKQSKPVIPTTEESLPSLDIIAALLIFCHFSPSTVYRYRNILQQAAVISSKTSENNDLNRLQQQCLTLIRQPYFTM
ncbi:unnamed protein product [Rotaria socialis]|uniref:BHLH domain-containing protein n=1 Tax=Rotaria socialis TaxID=392032 RepID=A0A821EZY1_9BILA|nr:unnamed protein product [Rotaria socialis]CAF4643260.1 unnamed protein product [Rotaria socialis]